MIETQDETPPKPTFNLDSKPEKPQEARNEELLWKLPEANPQELTLVARVLGSVYYRL